MSLGEVRPAPAPAGTSVRAQRRANLNAPSLASAPELQKNARAAKELSTIHCARRSPGSVRNRFDTCTSPVSSASCTARATPASP